VFNPQTAPYARYYLDTFRSAASALAVEAIDAPVHSTEEVEAFMTKLSREAGAGLVVMSDTSMNVYRKTIYSLAERYRLPTVYPYRFFVTEGGLMSYGIDVPDLLRGAASYADRILRGEKPNELAVQHQCEDREDARPRNSTDTTRHRRRGDRIGRLFAAVHGSVVGPKATGWNVALVDAIGGIADMARTDGIGRS
jgi:hypothetical protein